MRSGARNTANWAAGLGRVLMAVPGPVHSALSVGPHLLVREGQATLVTGAADVLELISPIGEQLVPVQRGEQRVTDGFTPIRLAVFEAVPARRRRTGGEIALTAGVPLRSALAELTAWSRPVWSTARPTAGASEAAPTHRVRVSDGSN